MIVREVGEAGDIERQTVDAVPGEGLRAHLDRDRVHAALAHQREQGVELGCLGGGEARGDHLVGDVPLSRRRQAADLAELLQDAVEQMRDARLAVGAGGTEEQRQVAVGAVLPGREITEDPARVLDGDHRDVEWRGELGALGIRHDRYRAALGGHLRELGSVALGAGKGDERLARSQIGGGEGHPADHDSGGVAVHGFAEPGDKLVE